MKEDFIIMHAFEDEGFGDTPFGAGDEKEVVRGGSASLDDSSFMRSKDQSNILLDESHVKDGSTVLDKTKIGTQNIFLTLCFTLVRVDMLLYHIAFVLHTLNADWLKTMLYNLMLTRKNFRSFKIKCVLPSY